MNTDGEPLASCEQVLCQIFYEVLAGERWPDARVADELQKTRSAICQAKQEAIHRIEQRGGRGVLTIIVPPRTVNVRFLFPEAKRKRLLNDWLQETKKLDPFGPCPPMPKVWEERSNGDSVLNYLTTPGQTGRVLIPHDSPVNIRCNGTIEFIPKCGTADIDMIRWVDKEPRRFPLQWATISASVTISSDGTILSEGA
jgi:hypothetical protein